MPSNLYLKIISDKRKNPTNIRVHSRCDIDIHYDKHNTDKHITLTLTKQIAADGRAMLMLNGKALWIEGIEKAEIISND